MNENMNHQLVKMLTDIYHQLEQFEDLLESTTAEMRETLHQQQTKKIFYCENKLAKLEEVYADTTVHQQLQSQPRNISTAFKLELGL